MLYCQVDYIMYDSDFITNISRVYAPLQVKMNEYATCRQYPVGRKIVGYSGILPIHQKENPYDKKRGETTFMRWYKHNKLII